MRCVWKEWARAFRSSVRLHQEVRVGAGLASEGSGGISSGVNRSGGEVGRSVVFVCNGKLAFEYPTCRRAQRSRYVSKL